MSLDPGALDKSSKKRQDYKYVANDTSLVLSFTFLCKYTAPYTIKSSWKFTCRSGQCPQPSIGVHTGSRKVIVSYCCTST